MAEWWENDPVAPAVGSQSVAADWWSKDPVVKPAQPIDVLGEVMSPARGFNIGFDALFNLPNQAVNLVGQGINYGAEKLGYERPLPEQLIEPARLATRFNDEYEPQTTAGRYAQTIGEVAGSSILPEAALISRASKLVPKVGDVTTQALKTASAAKGKPVIASPILEKIAEAGPTRTLQASAIPTVGAGVGTQAARDLELGPIGEMAAGLAGGFALPNVANVAARGVGTAQSAGRYARQAAQAARDPEGAAFRNIAEKGVQSGLDFDAMQRELSKSARANLKAKNLTEDDVAEIIGRQMKGEHPEDIAPEYKIAPQTARAYLRRYEEANPTPLNVIDVAKLTGGEGKAMPMTRYARAVHSIAGGEEGSIADALLARQEQQPGRVAGIIEKRMGGSDFAARKRANQITLKNESNKAYKKFYQEPDLATNELADLMEEPLFRNAVTNAQRQERLAIIAENQANRQLGRPTEPVPKLDLEAQVYSPRLLDKIQRDLRLTGEGFSNPNEAQYARDIRDVFLDRIEKFYPTFRELRHTYAGGKMEQQAFDAGIKLTGKLGAPTREALAEFETMTPAQKSIFRESFGAALQEKAANTPKGNQVANQFSSDAFRQIIEKLYPKSDKKLYAEGQKLLGELNIERVTTRTKNDVLSGSRTAELASDMDVITTPAEAAANAFTGNWAGILRTLHKRLEQQIGTEGAKASMQILGETSPDKLLPNLQRLAREARSYQERQAYVAALRAFKKAALDAGVSIGTVTDAEPRSDNRNQKQ